ncbi:MAG TPA: rhomboid family intramembrane serine protease [Vicinamibacterales bacterium]|nr:rhomboid family intramembrane serine protease [Vicinamibacterales bacterium]
MLRRRTSGSVVCPSCGSLVGVRDDKCYSCGRANPGLWGFGPMLRQLGNDLGFVPLVVGASAALYALTLIVSAGAGQLQPYSGGIDILSPSPNALVLFGASGAYPFFRLGAWWTILTASWLHGNLLHIVFNMMWVRDLGPATVDVIGPSRTVIIYTVAGVTGFLLSSVMPRMPIAIPFFRGANLTIGASAAIFGLLGALVHYGRISGSNLTYSTALRYAVILFVFGLIMPGVDNTAHAGGFLGGYATSAFFNPMTRERGDHLIAAVICLAATFFAILFSVLRGLGIL